MAVRELTDEHGTVWLVWAITPESIHPQTKAEDYLAGCYETGWLVFQTRSGEEKRRLCPVTARWAELSETELRELLAQAEPVSPRKLDVERQMVGETAPAAPPVADVLDEQALDVTDLHVVRSFAYPGGRLWTVCVIAHPERGGHAVLRFTAGARSIDLRVWPRDWADQPDERLIEMLRHAVPRLSTTPPAPGTPRRRWNDPPEERSV